MLSDIREDKINCVIVKDLSRFGRNYIESGRYIEKIFPMLGIRFIAVTDGYDSINEDMGSDMIIPFKNLINDAYCCDISIKIRSHMDIKRRNGEYIGAFAAYGYLKDKDNKNHLVVDDYAADVVRDIFAMKLCGMSQKTIADKLNEQGVLSPLQYKKSIGVSLESSFRKSVKPKWTYNSVLRILKNEVYTGTVIQGKYTTPNYKIKKRIYKDKSDWIRVEDMHDAIIDEEMWNNAQRLKRTVRREVKNGTYKNRLTGLLYCADCGAKLTYRSPNAPPRPDGKTYDSDNAFICGSYRSLHRDCTMHYIKVSVVEELIKKAIHTVSSFAIENEEEFIRRLEVLSDFQVETAIKDNKKALSTAERRVKELDELIRKLYEGNATGKIPDKHFERLLAEYDSEQGELEGRIEEIRNSIAEYEKNTVRTDKFMEVVRKYQDCKEITTPMLNEFIEKIVVHEAYSQQATLQCASDRIHQRK